MTSCLGEVALQITVHTCRDDGRGLMWKKSPLIPKFPLPGESPRRPLVDRAGSHHCFPLKLGSIGVASMHSFIRAEPQTHPEQANSETF